MNVTEKKTSISPQTKMFRIVLIILVTAGSIIGVLAAAGVLDKDNADSGKSGRFTESSTKTSTTTTSPTQETNNNDDNQNDETGSQNEIAFGDMTAGEKALAVLSAITLVDQVLNTITMLLGGRAFPRRENADTIYFVVVLVYVPLITGLTIARVPMKIFRDIAISALALYGIRLLFLCIVEIPSELNVLDKDVEKKIGKADDEVDDIINLFQNMSLSGKKDKTKNERGFYDEIDGEE